MCHKGHKYKVLFGTVEKKLSKVNKISTCHSITIGFGQNECILLC